MTKKRFTKVEHIFELNDEGIKDNQTKIEYYYALDLIDLLNELSEENKQLKQAVEYWKQVASQYSNELNVFEHCKKHKTECKDIYWNSD